MQKVRIYKISNPIFRYIAFVLTSTDNGKTYKITEDKFFKDYKTAVVFKRKIESQNIKQGSILQTRDEYFYGQSEYRKPGYQDKGNYRKSVVVDKNKNNELALVKLTTKGRFRLPDYDNGKSSYNAKIETLDDEGKSIRVGKKFIPANTKEMPQKYVREIKNKCLYGNTPYKQENHRKLKELKKND